MEPSSNMQNQQNLMSGMRVEERFFPGKIERSELAERSEASIRLRERAERSEASDQGSKQLGGLGGR